MAVQNMRGTKVRRYLECPRCGKHGVYGFHIVGRTDLGSPYIVDAGVRCRYCGVEHVYRGLSSNGYNGAASRAADWPGICEPEST